MNIKFVKRPVIEFANWVLYKNNSKLLNSIFPITLPQDENLSSFIKLLDDRTSNFIKSELNFFSYDILATALWAYITDYEVFTIDEFFHAFDNSSLEIFFKYIGGGFLFDNRIDSNTGWDKVSDSLPSMIEYIKSIKDLKLEDSEKLLDLYSSPEETKMRIRYLLWTLSKIYKTIEPEVLEILIEKEKEYVTLCTTDIEKFLKINFFDRFKLDVDSKITLSLTVSYFFSLGICLNTHIENKYGYFGCNNLRMFEYSDSKISLELFLKLLGDKTRQKILFLLSEKPYYIHELARELNLAASTINHHLQSFIAMNLVYFKEEKNKSYYYLNRDNIKFYLNLLNTKLNLN